MGRMEVVVSCLVASRPDAEQPVEAVAMLVPLKMVEVEFVELGETVAGQETASVVHQEKMEEVT